MKNIFSKESGKSELILPNILTFRSAVPADAQDLTRISFAAKRVWNYPEDFFELWKKELTITESYINKHKVFISAVDALTVGYCSIVFNPSPFMSGEVLIEKGYWMEHLFIDPEFMHQRIGSLLVDYAKYECGESGIKSLMIFVDPNAAGFYEKQGALFRHMSKSSIPGREIPVYEMII